MVVWGSRFLLYGWIQVCVLETLSQDSDAKGRSTPRWKSQDTCHQPFRSSAWKVMTNTQKTIPLYEFERGKTIVITDTLKFHKEVPNTSLVRMNTFMLFLSPLFQFGGLIFEKLLRKHELRYLTEALEKEKIIPKRHTRIGKISRSRRSMIADELVFPGLSQKIGQRSIDFFLVLLGSGVQIQAGCGVEDLLFSPPLGEMVIDRIRNYPRIKN